MEPTVKLTGFELIEMLGKGGIGAVWKARQLSLDRIVAIKLLLPEFKRDKEENRRLVVEARTVAKLKHSGIVQVYDASEENGVFFFVMEYVAGYSVGTWLRRKLKLPEADTITVGLAVADALDYAWRATKLIHCDIKPDNIMVDTDGTIKVADLGLSRTLDTRADDQLGDVLGTPSYMSPEQVQGQADLDYRTDIYALGATMYHMATGRRPFQEVPDREAADCQISGHLADAMDLNPALTPAFCAVLEKMLAKKRDDRYARWDEVGSDLRLVLARKALSTPLLQPGASTMQRSRKRSSDPVRIAVQAGKWALIGGLIILALLAIMALLKPLKAFVKEYSNQAPVTMAPEVAPPSVPVESQSQSVAPDLAAYLTWQAWYQSNLKDYDGSIARLTEIVRQHPGSEGAAKAGRVLSTIRKQREEAVRLAWERLESDANALAGRQKPDEAVRLLERYAGPFAAALQTRRTALAKTYRITSDTGQNVRRAQADLLLLDRLGALMSTGACMTANAEIASRLAELPAPSAELRDSLMRIASVISAVTNVEARVLSTFASQTWQLVSVEMGQGSQLLKIMGVADRRVRARTTDVDAEIGFGVADLSAAERERRLSLLSDDASWLRRGVIANSANNLDVARADFEKIAPPLGPLLLGQVDAQIKAGVEAKAQLAWRAILAEAGLNSGAAEDGGDAVTPEMAARLPLSAGVAEKTSKKLQAFREQFGTTLVANRTAPVYDALLRECKPLLQDAGVRKFAASDEAITRGADLKRALLDANPDLDPQGVECVEQDGQVVAIHLRADSLRSLTPIERAGNLRELSLEPVGQGSLMVDVRTLTRLPKLERLRLTRVLVPDPAVFSGLKLQDLTVERAGLRDLQWTKGMVLRRLNVSDNLIKDLGPLRSMEGLESLWLNDTGVINLDGMPLRGLRELGISRTSVRDLSMLRMASLDRLEVAGVKMSDWSWLRGLTLKYLDLSDCSFRELALLNRMPLQVLIMRNTGMLDFSTLKSLPLVQLDMSGTVLQDLTQLRGLRLEDLSLAHTRVTASSLNVLAGMPLRRLDLSATGVSDLKPLAGLPLCELNLTDTRARDLTPLRDMPLTSLFIEGTPVEDLTPLKGMAIEFLKFTVDGKHDVSRSSRHVLRGLTSLKEVNGRRVNGKFFDQLD